jgi:hypothetical protein
MNQLPDWLKPPIGMNPRDPLWFLSELDGFQYSKSPSPLLCTFRIRGVKSSSIIKYRMFCKLKMWNDHFSKSPFFLGSPALRQFDYIIHALGIRFLTNHQNTLRQSNMAMGVFPWINFPFKGPFIVEVPLPLLWPEGRKIRIPIVHCWIPLKTHEIP